jgi:hypothetical protein
MTRQASSRSTGASIGGMGWWMARHRRHRHATQPVSHVLRVTATPEQGDKRNVSPGTAMAGNVRATTWAVANVETAAWRHVQAVGVTTATRSAALLSTHGMRDTHTRDKYRPKNRPPPSTCKSAAFSWSAGGDNDEDGDYEHPGHGSLMGDTYWGVGRGFPHERTHSPHDAPTTTTAADTTTTTRR